MSSKYLRPPVARTGRRHGRRRLQYERECRPRRAACGRSRRRSTTPGSAPPADFGQAPPGRQCRCSDPGTARCRSGEYAKLRGGPGPRKSNKEGRSPIEDRAPSSTEQMGNDSGPDAEEADVESGRARKERWKAGSRADGAATPMMGWRSAQGYLQCSISRTRTFTDAARMTHWAFTQASPASPSAACAVTGTG